MPRTEVPLILAFTRWFGSRQMCAERPTLTPEALAAAWARFRLAGITARVIQAGIGAVPLAEASLDLVIAAQVLEHLPEPVAALAELRRLLRPGVSVVTCMTRLSWLGACIQAKWRTHSRTPCFA